MAARSYFYCHWIVDTSILVLFSSGHSTQTTLPQSFSNIEDLTHIPDLGDADSPRLHLSRIPGFLFGSTSSFFFTLNRLGPTIPTHLSPQRCQLLFLIRFLVNIQYSTW